MVETITAAGCGGRRRQILALVSFGVAAVVAAALVGAAAGALGALAGARVALVSGSALALVAAVAALTRRRLLPELARQVPEPWRRERPVAAWSGGYGAILGAGLLTHQPLGGGWVAAGAALACANPFWGAVVGATAGAGRVVMVLPALAGAPGRAAAGLVARAPAARTSVVAATALCTALILGSGAANGAEAVVALETSESGRARAVTVLGDDGPQVVVRVPGIPEVVIPRARQPWLDGPKIAVQSPLAVRVVDWTTGAEVAVVAGGRDPALTWPYLAYRLSDGRESRLMVRDLRSGRSRRLDSRRAPASIGRPSARRGVIAWHVARPSGSQLLAAAGGGGPIAVVYRSRLRGLRSPAVGQGRIAWVEEDARCSAIWSAPVSGGSPTLVATRPSAWGRYWTLALAHGTVTATIWDQGTGRTWVESFAHAAPPATFTGCPTEHRSPLRQARPGIRALPRRR